VVGRRPVLGGACVLAVLFSYPLFVLMDSENTTLAVLAHCGLGLILGIFLGPTLAAMNEMFSTRVRYGGFSLGYNFSVSFFGGTAPFLVTFLVARTGIIASPAFYIMASALITLVVVLTAKETAPRKTGEA
jgi:MHS family proline/betaine transporter-like MFS transporter